MTTVEPRALSARARARDHDAPIIARTVVVIVFAGFCVVELLNIATQGRGALGLATCVVFMLAVMALQIGYFGRSEPPRIPAAWWGLAAQAALVYLPILEFHEAWVGMPGFLAGSLLLVLPMPFGVIGFGAVVGSMLALQYGFTASGYDVAYTGVSTVITGGVVFGLTRLAGLIVEVARARTELAVVAVDAERARFSQDLHDLLGYSLSAIALKAELSQRLLDDDTPGTRRELGEILDISQRAVADVRAVARGDQGLSLERETDSLHRVLASADIQARIEVDLDGMPDEVATVLATVLREAVTNMLRHSAARSCELVVGSGAAGARLWLANDGVGPVPPGPPGEQGGLVNLERRVTVLGGRLEWGVGDDGRFHFEAVVPLPARAAAGTDVGAVARPPR